MPNTQHPCPTCCICGCDLPNRYAAGGNCEEPGCEKAFCQYHWRNGNQRCREHGWEEKPGSGNRERGSSLESPPRSIWSRILSLLKGERTMNGDKMNKARSIVKSSMEALKKAGGLASDLLAKLKKDDSPEAMLATLEEGLKANRKRREDAADQVESLHKEIAVRKKAYATAVPARKKIIETELRSLLAAYKSAENQLTVLLENERVLSTVKGRMLEVVSYDLATVTEDQIDDVIDRIEEAVEEAEGRVAATRDLEKAGKRRTREEDTESLWEELKGFEEETTQPAGLEQELAGFDEPEEKPVKKKQAEGL